MPFRLRFDVPREFAYEPGFVHARHCRDFRPDKDSSVGTYRDPATGLLILEPSFFRETYGQGFKSLSAWNYVAGDWEEFNRAAEVLATGSGGDPLPRMYTPLFPPTTGSVLSVESSITLATAIRGSQLLDDRLVWAMESTFSLADDESFALHVRGATDELRRQKNFFAMSWGHVYLHLGYDGLLSCYLYDRDTPTTPELFWQEPFVDPGNIANRDLWLMVIPIPGFGLSVSHSLSGPQNWKSAISTGWQTATKSTLIPVPSETDSGTMRVVRSSTFKIAVNPSLNGCPRLGYYAIRYTTLGTYTDAPFDFGYKPSGAPGTVSSQYLGQSTTGATAALKKLDGVTAWAVGERQARVKVSLSTSNSVYTPFVYTTYVERDGVRELRDTTPVEPFSYELSYSEDEGGRMEGVAVATFLSDAGKAICERGDATFQVDYRASAEDDWEPVFCGLAAIKGDVLEIYEGEASLYKATWSLTDDTALLAESHVTLKSAFDGLTIGEAINTILRAAGEPVIASGDIPAPLNVIVVPAIQAGQSFRHGAKTGEHGYKTAQALLNLARQENKEWQIISRYDSSSGAPSWRLRQKPFNVANPATLWFLTPYSNEANTVLATGATASLAVEMIAPDGILRFSVTPPEANSVQAIGYTGTDPNTAERVHSVPLINSDSLHDNASPDYLGRFRCEFPEFQGITDQAELNLAAIRVYEASAHRRVTVGPHGIFGYFPTLLPNTRWKVRGVVSGGGRGNKFGGINFWCKRITVKVGCDGDGHDLVETTILLDSNWYGEMI